MDFKGLSFLVTEQSLMKKQRPFFFLAMVIWIFLVSSQLSYWISFIISTGYCSEYLLTATVLHFCVINIKYKDMELNDVKKLFRAENVKI